MQIAYTGATLCLLFIFSIFLSKNIFWQDLTKSEREYKKKEKLKFEVTAESSMPTEELQAADRSLKMEMSGEEKESKHFERSEKFDDKKEESLQKMIVDENIMQDSITIYEVGENLEITEIEQKIERSAEEARKWELELIDNIQVPSDLPVISFYESDLSRGQVDMQKKYQIEYQGQPKENSKGFRSLKLYVSKSVPFAITNLPDGENVPKSMIEGLEGTIFSHKDRYLAIFALQDMQIIAESKGLAEEEWIHALRSILRK